MNVKRVFRYFPSGDLRGMENMMNAMSRTGWQPQRAGRFVQTYARGEGVYVHRFGYCAHRSGSAGEIAWRSAQERAGWAVAFQRKGWVLFRKPAAFAAEGETLTDGRDSIRALFKGRIARLEALRRWMLVLASGLMIGGYCSDLLPVLYATALPLAVSLIVTYRIKFMEEGLKK